jgi:hypothetical protein
MIYSYLKASIGSILAAFTAGAYPETTPTIKQTIIPVSTQTQGIIKLDLSIDDTAFPIRIPRIIPKKPPSCPIIIDSKRN